MLEGLIEGIARKNPSISHHFLRERARVFIERDGDFCWDTMMKGFWQYGTDRVDSHPAYQFSRLTVDRIVDEINRISQNFTRPFEGIFSLLSQYSEGGYAKYQIPFLFFLEYATGLNIDKIQSDILTE